MLSVILALIAGCARVAYSAQFPAYSLYNDYDDYYFMPKPAIRYPYYSLPQYEDVYRPYPYYKPIIKEDPLRMEERAAREAALPVGQETWFESDPPTPRWRQAGLDDVNAAFLQNLIISQMARNAENRVRANEPQQFLDTADESYGERDARDFEDEDVRELKALAGKPISHSAKTELHPAVPTNNYEYYDYPADESFINWGSKRSVKASEEPTTSTHSTTTTSTPITSTSIPIEGQREEVMMRPATPVRHPFPEPVMKMLQQNWRHEKRSNSVYDELKHMLVSESNSQHKSTSQDRTRLKKRFVASEQDLVSELRGLKRRIST